MTIEEQLRAMMKKYYENPSSEALFKYLMKAFIMGFEYDTKTRNSTGEMPAQTK